MNELTNCQFEVYGDFITYVQELPSNWVPKKLDIVVEATNGMTVKRSISMCRPLMGVNNVERELKMIENLALTIDQFFKQQLPVNSQVARQQIKVIYAKPNTLEKDSLIITYQESPCKLNL